MSKLTVLSGLQASGKSTRAKELLQEYGNAVRLNRDLLREMLHHHWTPKNEGWTISAEIKLATMFLQAGQHVIIDDINFNPKIVDKWKRVAQMEGAQFGKIFVDTPLEECIKRDAFRPNPVGWDVITNTAIRYGIYKPKKGYVLVDLDGTMCDISHRLHFVRQEPKDWDGFFQHLSVDLCREEVKEQVRQFQSLGYDIVFVSGRPDIYKKQTLDWLACNGFSEPWRYKINMALLERLGIPFTEIPYLSLIMRRGSDRRPDYLVKEEILRTYFPDLRQIHKIIDDRKSVVAMWRSHGLDVIDVGTGEDF